MRLLHYLEIQNFKRFGDSRRIELDHPAVLIGPNNCGKTTAIEAVALWSQAVKTWHVSKGKAPPKERTSTSLNRLNIVSVPAQRTRYFWHKNERSARQPRYPAGRHARRVARGQGRARHHALPQPGRRSDLLHAGRRDPEPSRAD